MDSVVIVVRPPWLSLKYLFYELEYGSIINKSRILAIYWFSQIMQSNVSFLWDFYFADNFP